MKRKLTILLAVLVLVLMVPGLAGCGKTEGGAQTDNTDKGETAQNTLQVQQYFASTEYIVMSVDEENGELMPPVETEIEIKEGENPYLAAVNSLKTVPEGQDMYSTIVSDRYVINDISVEDEVAYVDFSSEGLNGGTIDEVILVDQIVYTLSNTFDDVAAVRFLVDGEEAETLMGAVDITEVFIADYL